MTSKSVLTSFVIACLLVLQGAETASAYYSPQSGRFMSRDPIMYADGSSAYCAYFIPHATDPSGTRTFKITIDYFFECPEIVNNLPEIQKYAEKKLNECLDSCVAKGTDGKPKHTIVFNWNQLKDKDEYTKSKNTSGWTGRSHLGYTTGYPLTGINITGQDFSTLPVCGKTTKFAFEISCKSAMNINNKRQDDKKPFPMDILFGGTIAHEIGTHILAGYSGHDSEKGDIDSESGRLDGTWGAKACKKMCKQMEIDN